MQPSQPSPVNASRTPQYSSRKPPNTQPNLIQQPPQAIRFPEVDVEILEEVEFIPTTRLQHFPKTRRWLRSRTGRILLPLITLLIGLIVGIGSVFWYGWSGEGPIVIVPNSNQGNFIVEVSKDLITPLVRANIVKAGLPGQVENVNVTLAQGNALTIQGDDVYSVPLVGSLSRHFTVDVQPYTDSCALKVRVTHADLNGIPITGFAQSFESNIDQQLAQKPSNLPSGFTYCAIGVRTEPANMFVTYQGVVSS